MGSLWRRLLRRPDDDRSSPAPVAAPPTEAEQALFTQLLVALQDTGHNYLDTRARAFVPYLARFLRPGEKVATIGWAELLAPMPEEHPTAAAQRGYLVVTDRRLLLLDDLFYPDTYPGRVNEAFHPRFPRYDIVWIERAAITGLTRTEGTGRDTVVVIFAEGQGSVLAWNGEELASGRVTLALEPDTLDTVLGTLGQG